MMTSAKSTNGKKKVLLIGWDGADWEHITPMLDRGILPTLDGLINGGVMGNLATLQPVLSPMLWNSVATCKFPVKHGIHGFTEPDPVNGGARPYTSLSRKTKALWNIFSQNGIRSNVINWWASHPAEKINGCIVSNSYTGVQLDLKTGWKIGKGTIHPAEKEQAFAKFKVFESELTEQHILPFIPNAADIDQKKDKRLSMFARTLAETATTHSIATAIMETEPWDFMAVYYTGIDHFSHGFMQYHPPRMPSTREDDFEMYKGVIEGAYRFHDMMLARLLELAGDDTTIILCSDHGFQSKEYRPGAIPREPAGPAIWHRQYGIVVMKGEGIKKDERIYGASLIDIGPTILSLYGLPIGDDMDGRPLSDAFENPPEIKTIPSWDDVEGDHGMHASDIEMDKGQSEELMQQFVALGYIDDQGDDKEKQQLSAEVESKYNLARSLSWQNDLEPARKLFEEILHLAPWETRFIVQLSDCYFKAGYLNQAEHLIRNSFDFETTQVVQILIIYAKVLYSLGREDEGLEFLFKAEQRAPRQPNLHVQIGNLYVLRRKWDEAERSYRRAIELQPDDALALQGLSTVYVRQGRNQDAVDAALDALGLLYRLPKAHFNLGVALARSGDSDRAIQALETALRFSPQMHNAHRWLSMIYRSQLGNDTKAVLHRIQGTDLIGPQEEQRKLRKARCTMRFDLPDFESESGRLDRLIKERPSPNDPVVKSGKTFVLVSGLPRSGTSLMMQMLVAGGMDVISDEKRVADPDNPRGYFEWDDIKQIAKNPELLDDHESGHALKTISMLLASLPREHDYKIIFMMRPIEEIAASQKKMIDRLDTDGAQLDDDDLIRSLANHRLTTENWMRDATNVEFVKISYPDLIDQPETTIPQITEFLEGDFLKTPEKMIDVIDPSLYRQKAAPQQPENDQQPTG